jgi:Uma2 family endonuclease
MAAQRQMAAQGQVGTLWTVQEYLDMERCSTVRHEYHGGYVLAMAGGTQAHSLIALNIGALLRPRIRGSGCRAFTSDMKVRQSPNDYVYADVVVSCDPRDNVPDQEWLAYPKLVIEVLSRRTEQYDRGAKFDDYKAITTLQEYVLVGYRRRQVEVWRRDEADAWAVTTYGPGDTVALQSLDLTLGMDQIYEDSGL